MPTVVPKHRLQRHLKGFSLHGHRNTAPPTGWQLRVTKALLELRSELLFCPLINGDKSSCIYVVLYKYMDSALESGKNKEHCILSIYYINLYIYICVCGIVWVWREPDSKPMSPKISSIFCSPQKLVAPPRSNLASLAWMWCQHWISPVASRPRAAGCCRCVTLIPQRAASANVFKKKLYICIYLTVVTKVTGLNEA